MTSCILYQNAESTVTILDIPRSIEEAQGFYHGDEKRIISSKAIEQPFASVEPKSAKALRNAEPIPIKTLLLERFLQIALEEVQTIFKGPWCSPRAIGEETSREVSQVLRQNTTVASEDNPPQNPQTQPTLKSQSPSSGDLTPDHLFHQNLTSQTQILYLPLPSSSETPVPVPTIPPVLIPPHSTLLLGPLFPTSQIFKSHAPKLNLAILDPPWPNRSAARSGSYSVARSPHDSVSLLECVPLGEYLADDALVGVWVTNRQAVSEVVLGRDDGDDAASGNGDGGLFGSWDLELIEEWVWLKVTTGGEPICALGSTWRKAYEILLVGRKKKKEKKKQIASTGSTGSTADMGGTSAIDDAIEGVNKGATANNSSEVKRRVIISVPDIHSRKPNLKTLFEPMLPPKYEALEVFARNLTAGWWSWGDEVLKFQGAECWV